MPFLSDFINQAPTYRRGLLSNLRGFAQDTQSQQQVGQGLLDAANRGLVAQTLGAPVDMATTLTNLLRAGYGYAGNKLGLLSASQMPDLLDPGQQVGSSEWIGNQLAKGGFVSQNRNPAAETLAGLLAPAAYKGAQKIGGLLYNAESNALANAAKPSTMAMQGQRGVLNMGSETSNPIDQSYPGAQEFVKKVEKLAEERGPIYVRWSANEAHDLTPGAVSRDYLSGGQHAGLSAVPIDATTHPVDIAKKLAEYNFLRMDNPGATPKIYIGKLVGRDSDGYASINPTEKALDVPAEFINHIDRDFAKAYDIFDSITEAKNKISSTSGAARSIWEGELSKLEGRLSEILKRHTK